MRKLKIDYSELEFAFENYGDEVRFYLDKETGNVLQITEEEQKLAESIHEEYYNKDTGEIDWDSAFEETDIPDWEQEGVKNAELVEINFSERIIRIPSEDSHEGYNDMEDFVFEVKNKRIQQRLEDAINGRGAFRRFKNVLQEYPAERELWFEFKNNRTRQRILDWLESEDISLDDKEG